MKRFLLMTDAMGQGGAERQLVCLAEELKKQNCKVRLVTFYNQENFYAPQLEKCGIDMEIFSEGQKGWRRPFVIRRIIREWNPDVVIAYKPGTAMASCIARMFGKFNLVVSERNTTQELNRGERLRFFLYRWADHIVPNSQSQSDFIAQNFPSLTPKVKVITNMVDTDTFVPSQRTADNFIPQVLTTARVAPQKNILTYIDAITELKRRNIRVHFNWYGRIDKNNEYWNRIQESIKRNNISDMVTFHGITKDPVSAYQNADLFFLPSEYEGFPNVLCEAMSCGLPAIATNVCDNHFILSDSRWLCDYRSPVNMADKIESVLTLSEETRNQIGRNNRQIVIELCSPQAFVKKYLSFSNMEHP